MSEELQEKETPIKPEEEETSEEFIPEEESGEPTPTKADEEGDTSEGEDVEQLKRKLKEYKARMEHHKKKQRELEAKLKEMESKKPERVNISPLDLAKTVLKLKDYTPKELEFIETVAHGKGISPEEAVDLPEVKDFVRFMREKVEKEQKTPEPSTRTSPSKKPFEEITPEDLNKMSLEEKEKYFKWFYSRGKPKI